MVFGWGQESPSGPALVEQTPLRGHAPEEALYRRPRGLQRARICEWSLRFPRFWSGELLAHVTAVSAPSAPRRVSPASKILLFIYVFQWFLRMDTLTPSAGPRRLHSCASSSLLSPLLRIFDRVMLEPRSCIENLRKSLRWVAKNEALLRKLCRTLGPKSSRASGWHAKTPDVQFILCFTGQTGPPVQFP